MRPTEDIFTELKEAFQLTHFEDVNSYDHFANDDDWIIIAKEFFNGDPEDIFLSDPEWAGAVCAVYAMPAREAFIYFGRRFLSNSILERVLGIAVCKDRKIVENKFREALNHLEFKLSIEQSKKLFGSGN